MNPRWIPRKALRLLFMQGWGVHSLARMFGIPRKELEARLRRAIR
jgi:DNA-directed RNA polymerase specialized sigma24 family protein